MTNVKIQIIENITKPNTLFSHHHFNIQISNKWIHILKRKEKPQIF
jgi:hypothetical protein